jgi:hexosaminidase
VSTGSATGAGSATLTAKIGWRTATNTVATATVTAPIRYSCPTAATSPTRPRPRRQPGDAYENTPGTNAIDGNPATFWGTEWSGNEPPPPHDIVVDLGSSATFCSVGLLPCQDSDNGQIKDYAIYATNDAAAAAGTSLGAWGDPIAAGSLQPGRQLKKLDLANDVAARYLLLRALSEQRGNPWTTLAELTLEQR